MSGKPLGQPAFFVNKKLAMEIQFYQEDLKKPQPEEPQTDTTEPVAVEQAIPETKSVDTKMTAMNANSLTKGLPDVSMLRSRSFGATSMITGVFDNDAKDVISILDEVCEMRLAV